MTEDTYSAKEAMTKLRLPTTTFYRKVNDGQIPYNGKRPMRFPKEAIDAIAEIDAEDEKPDQLQFKVSPRGGLWKIREALNTSSGAGYPIPYKTMLEWRKSNEKIFLQASQGDDVLGWVMFLPLEEEMITALIEGKMEETELPSEAIKKWDTPQISVYVSNLQVVETKSEIHDKVVAAFLIRNTIRRGLKLMDQYDLKNWYAIGTSSTSQAILEALGFKQIASLDGGKKKAYRLDSLVKPTKLLRAFLPKR